MDDYLACPRCKTTKFTNPNIKLLVNVCGHNLCENCVELLFSRGAGACPQCNIPLRRNNFRIQFFEDSSVEKEVDIRKKILKDFNKREEDFLSLRDYNDYLEEIETIIFNLVHNIDIENTKKKIEQYRKDNKNLIVKNKSKLSKDEQMLEEILEVEQQEAEIRRTKFVLEEKQEKNMKKKNKEELIDKLMFYDFPASHILATHAVKSNPITKAHIGKRPEQKLFSTGIEMNRLSYTSFLPITKEDLYSYKAPTYDLSGPELPDLEIIIKDKYLNHVKPATYTDECGGYTSNLACQRALLEAFCGLFCEADGVTGAPSTSGSSGISDMNVADNLT